MTYKYQPRDTVWYIEARASQNAIEPPSMGSAVVIWLKFLDAELPRKYLLTCSHVVRQCSSDRIPNGRLLENVLCWPPDHGYTRLTGNHLWPNYLCDGIWTATILDVLKRPKDQIQANRFSDADDWLLLDVVDPDFQEYESVDAWGEISDDHGANIQVIGYPNGANSWPNGKPVEPYIATGFKLGRRSDSPGIMRLEGNDRTAPGMSGGGVFDRDGRLVGLHRAQNEAQLVFGAVRAAYIEKKLSTIGFRVISTKIAMDEPKNEKQLQRFNQEIGAYPIGPFVKAFETPLEIIKFFADHFVLNPMNAALCLSEAMQYRKKCNPEGFSDSQILVSPGELPDPKAGLENNWAAALLYAGQRSRRTLASLFLVPSAPQFYGLRSTDQFIVSEFLTWLENPT